MRAIINTKLVMEDGIIWDGAIVWEGDKITRVGERTAVVIPEGAEVIDAGGLYTAPGLIDIHNHGSMEHLFCDEPLQAAEHFLRHGETTVLPAFYCNLNLERMLENFFNIQYIEFQMLKDLNFTNKINIWQLLMIHFIQMI